MAENKSGTWVEMKPYIDAVAEKIANIPPPPKPDDDMGEKMNRLNKAIESLSETLTGRIQMEEEWE